MMEFLALICFVYMSYSIVSTAIQERSIFTEFNQSRSFAWLSILYPLGPLIYYMTVYRFGWLIAITLLCGCYLPGLIISKERMRFFETTGTDRVKRAHDAATRAFGTAIAGMVYTVFNVVMLFLGFVSSLSRQI